MEIEDEEPRVVRSLQRSPPSIRVQSGVPTSPLGHGVVSTVVTGSVPLSEVDEHNHNLDEEDEIQEQEETVVRNLDLNGLMMSDDSQVTIVISCLIAVLTC